MKRGNRKVRSLMTRTFIVTALFSFLLFTFVVVLFGFTLEDEIFELQVSEAADEFVAGEITAQAPKGKLRSLEMEYFVGTENMPDWLRAKINPALEDQFFEVFAEEQGHFHAVVRTLASGERVYVLFNARRFIRSTPQIIAFLQGIGVMAAAIFLLALFFMNRMSRRVSAPLEYMSAVLVDGDEVETSLRVPEDAPAELHALAAAINERDDRIKALIERESQFNKDVSHELRTPLAVAFGAAEVLEEARNNHRAMSRLTAAIKDMQTLTEGILWLGRDADKSQVCRPYDVCKESITTYEHLIGKRNVEIMLKGDEDVIMPVPDAVAHVLIGNILRNALSYTDEGEVLVRVSGESIIISDTGVGYGKLMEGREGFGIGLALVARLCKHFELKFGVAERQEGGTAAKVSW